MEYVEGMCFLEKEETASRQACVKDRKAHFVCDVYVFYSCM